MIAYCGLDCSKCEAQLATIENSHAKRVEIAQKWSQMYQHEMSPDQINCDGCKSGGTKFFHCSNCEIRQCCISRKIDTCASCDEYICDALAGFIKIAPQAGLALESLR